MKMTKEVITAYVTNNIKVGGRSQQDIEDDFKLMLKQKVIDIDDYSNAMEIIYDGERG